MTVKKAVKAELLGKPMADSKRRREAFKAEFQHNPPNVLTRILNNVRNGRKISKRFIPPENIVALTDSETR